MEIDCGDETDEIKRNVEEQRDTDDKGVLDICSLKPRFELDPLRDSPALPELFSLSQSMLQLSSLTA